MGELEAILRELYARGDPRILVTEFFQKEPHTYIKVVVNDGLHDIIVQDIGTYPFAFRENAALKATMQSAIRKIASIITERELASVIKRFSCDPV